jgi:ribosomal protein S18 acetylase RimI-like enzyme
VSAELRAATPDDAPAIKRLLDEHALASFGELELSEDEIRSWFKLPNLWFRLAERDGEVVGYLDVGADESGHFDVDARTLDADVAGLLVCTAEERGGELAETPVLRGYVQGELAEPDWPDGLRPRNARPGEEERVYEAHMDAFADHWDFRRQPFEVWRSYSTETHRYDPSLWWLVEDGDELAAISLNSWHSSGDPRFGWIHVLGVRPAWRKRGLATALLRHSFRDFRQHGATRVGLGVDGENTNGAVRLYETVGMRQVRRNDTYEKKL